LFRVSPSNQAENNTEIRQHDSLLSGKSVLIVEDDEDVGQVFKIGLEKAGCIVTLVDNGSKAIAEVNRQMPDAVVLDLMMPEVNGLDFIRYVRKINTHVPLLVVSAATGGFQMNKAIETGADAFVGKPISIHELVKALGQVFAAKL
jgi:two-component system, OmpR family, response regulator